MTKSEIIQRMSQKNTLLRPEIIEQSVNSILETLSSSQAKGDRVEIRGFGSYNLKQHAPRKSRNPKTGEKFLTTQKMVIRFRPAKDLRERVNNLRKKYIID